MKLLQWLLGKKGNAAAAPRNGGSVAFDEEKIVRTLADGSQESITWDQIQKISIVTTDEGPFVDDVFWVIQGAQGGCLVPSETEGSKELLARLQQLPAFNNEAVIQAMGSTSNAEFVCWQASNVL